MNLKQFTTKKTTSLNELTEMLKLLGVKILNSDNVFKDEVRFNKEGCYIINIGDDDVGTHWTGAYKKGSQVCYFDSFGVPAPELIETQLDNKYHFNPYQIQAVGDGLCGQYVVLWLYCMSKKKKPSLVETYKDFLLLWDLEQPRNNPKLVEKYFGHLYWWL